MTARVWQFVVPIIFLIYAYKLYIGRPSFNDSFGFPTQRARESEEIWNYVQRAAGAVCFFIAIFLGICSVVFLVILKESMVAYWTHIALEIACLVALIPIVNALTNKKFPPKKKGSKKR